MNSIEKEELKAVLEIVLKEYTKHEIIEALNEMEPSKVDEIRTSKYINRG